MRAAMAIFSAIFALMVVVTLLGGGSIGLGANAATGPSFSFGFKGVGAH